MSRSLNGGFGYEGQLRFYALPPFDQIFDLVETGARVDADAYPRWISSAIARTATASRGVAGFRPNEIDIVAQPNRLTITGRQPEGYDKREYLHRGFAIRAFERRFQLADFIEGSGARCENGLLSIELRRVVPAMKPRKTEIGDAPTNDRLSAPTEADRDAA